jgi:hypothetical protein
MTAEPVPKAAIKWNGILPPLIKKPQRLESYAVMANIDSITKAFSLVLLRKESQ